VLQAKGDTGGGFMGDLVRGNLLKRIMPWHPNAQRED
jgi:hypothetical protein